MNRTYHRVKPNETTRLPRRYIFLDCEAKQRPRIDGVAQYWRLGCAAYWDMEKNRKEHFRTADYDDAATLWKEVSDFAVPRARTVLYAHNIAYDLRISGMLNCLPAMGWELDSHNLSGRSVWLCWHRDGATLLCCDSTSIFGISIAQLGQHFGLGKPELPAMDRDTQDWKERCRADVAILSTAMQAYLRWLESADMGNWQRTGGGQAYATFRHKFLTHPMYVHDDEHALALERRAMWTGRCEAYWHGQAKHETFQEWDMTLAYPRVVRDCGVPTKLIGPMRAGDDGGRWAKNPKVAYLASVRVATDVPVVPTQLDGHIAWPVGVFSTVLWSPEIERLRECGATVDILEGYLYRLEPALKSWAQWVIDTVEDTTGTVPAWLKVFVKSCGRSLIGRFGMSYKSWRPYGQVPHSDLLNATVYDSTTGEEREFIHVGTQVFAQGDSEEWPESMPAITGYVMSECRARLWDLLRRLPDHVALYTDTDSILCAERHDGELARVAATFPHYGLRLKRAWDGLAVWGPRQIVTGNNVRISGIPRRAERTGNNDFHGQVWESPTSSAKRGHYDEVWIAERKWHVKGVDRRRVVGQDGWTAPIRVDQT